MARDGSPGDDYPDSDPTQYANYGGTGEAYSDTYATAYPPAYPEETGYGQYPPLPPPTPWYQRPAALIGLGVLTAAVLALLVYAIVKFTRSGDAAPAVTTTTSTSSSSATTARTTAQESTSTQSVAPAPATSTTTTQSPTETPTTTSAAPSTTSATPTPTTTTTISTTVTTVTETTTKRVLPTLPTLRPPTLREPPPSQ